MFAELVGITAVVVSLVFVGVQLRQTQEIARRDGFNNALIGGIEARSNIFEHAEIWFRGNEGAILDPVERTIYLDLFETEFNRYLYQTLQVQVMTPTTELTTEITFAGFLFRNPGARSAWEEMIEKRTKYVDPFRSTESLTRSKSSGSHAFVRRIDEYLRKLETLYPNEIQ